LNRRSAENAEWPEVHFADADDASSAGAVARKRKLEEVQNGGEDVTKAVVDYAIKVRAAQRRRKMCLHGEMERPRRLLWSMAVMFLHECVCDVVTKRQSRVG
jgi:hypothetical protein